MKILHVDASARHEGSHSRALSRHFVEALRARAPGLEVDSLDLATDPLPHFGALEAAAVSLPADQHTPEMAAAIAPSDALAARVLAADGLVIGTPIWLGVKSSVATLAIERLYAYSGEKNEHGQYLYYGKTGGCVVTGNEDGVKACSMETLYALSHIGYTIPPQADCGWLGEIGPGPSYGDQVDGSDTPAGYDSEFTNKNTTIMTWNLMHTAKMLKDQGGFPVGGNVAETWRESTNAEDQDPDAF